LGEKKEKKKEGDDEVLWGSRQERVKKKGDPYDAKDFTKKEGISEKPNKKVNQRKK